MLSNTCNFGLLIIFWFSWSLHLIFKALFRILFKAWIIAIYLQDRVCISLFASCYSYFFTVFNFFKVYNYIQFNESVSFTSKKPNNLTSQINLIPPSAHANHAQKKKRVASLRSKLARKMSSLPAGWHPQKILQQGEKGAHPLNNN